jgi:hypothetical protein
VTDTATGLTWMKVDSGDRSLRGALGKTHYKDGRMDWPEALAFCENLSFAGADDWRLPSAKELQSLLDYSRSPSATKSAAIDPVFSSTKITNEAKKPDFPGYWASTTHLDGRVKGGDAVVVFFGEALGEMGPGGPGGRHPGGQSRMGQPGGQPRAGMPPPRGKPPFGEGQPPPRRNALMRMLGLKGPPPPPGAPGMGHQGPGQGPGPGATGRIMDVHGAGAQRSDPKTGDPAAYPVSGMGPQGDVRRVYNYVRCVRIAG